MDRRGFFKVIGALAAVAATGPALAALTDPHAKYRRARELFLSAVEVSTDERLCSARMDLLLAHLHANFPVPECTAAEIAATRNLLRTGDWKKPGGPEEFNVLGIPPGVADVLYPIAMMKLGLCTHDMGVSANLLPEFDTFRARYGRLFFSAFD